jgi:hypothetical protein
LTTCDTTKLIGTDHPSVSQLYVLSVFNENEVALGVV